MENQAITNKLENIKVNVKIKLSALWASLMFCYIYGDIFTLFVPGHIKSLMDGHMGIGTTTPVKLLCVAILMSIPALMVFLSVALKAAINRWINIVTGLLYAAIMVLTVISSIHPWWLFYTFLGIVEILITLVIVWQAWKWPGS